MDLNPLIVVQGWKRIPILLRVETIGMSSTFDNNFPLMVRSLQDFGGLGLKDLEGKMVNMGGDNNIIFKGNQTNVTSQFKEKAILFIVEFIVLLTNQIYLCSFFHN
jgi:signal transduction histidine kinase